MYIILEEQSKSKSLLELGWALPCSEGTQWKKAEPKLMEAIVFLHYTVHSSGFEYICVFVICFWEKGGGKDDGRMGRGKVYRGRKKEGERKKQKGKNREKEDGMKGVLGETGWKARTCEEGRGDKEKKGYCVSKAVEETPSPSPNVQLAYLASKMLTRGMGIT